MRKINDGLTNNQRFYQNHKDDPKWKVNHAEYNKTNHHKLYPNSTYSCGTNPNSHPSKYNAEERKILQRERTKKCTMKKRVTALKLIGDKCVVCGSTKRLCFHEIHGKFHKCSLKYYCEHFQDFISLCYRHHRVIHEIIEYPQIIGLFKQIVKGEPKCKK